MFLISSLHTLHCAAGWTPSSRLQGHQQSWPDLVCSLCIVGPESDPWLTIRKTKHPDTKQTNSRVLTANNTMKKSSKVIRLYLLNLRRDGKGEKFQSLCNSQYFSVLLSPLNCLYQIL